MSGERPAGYVSKDPRPLTEIGGLALHSTADGKRYTPDEIDVHLMAYTGYPAVQASLLEGNTDSTEPQIPATTTPEESLSERIARTRYIATATPLHDSKTRRVDTLTTEVL